MTDREFKFRLRDALSGVSNNRRWGKNYGRCAPKLLPILARCVAQCGPEERGEAADPKRGFAEGQWIAADEIFRKTVALLKLLDRHQPKIKDAIEHHYLKISIPPGRGTTSLAEVALPGWGAEREAVEVLGRLKTDTARWVALARADARLLPGQKLGTRIILTEFVILQLAPQGIPLTKGNAGYLARVLRVVYQAAGVKTKYVFRDIQQAFENKELQLLHTARRHCKL